MKNHLLILLLLITTPSFCQQSFLYDDDSFSYNQSLFNLFNKERSKHLLRKLDYDSSKQKALDDKAKRMSEKGGYKHDRSGFDGEIILMAGYYLTPEEAIQTWMGSPGHRALILKRFQFKTMCAGTYQAPGGYMYSVIRMYE